MVREHLDSSQSSHVPPSILLYEIAQKLPYKFTISIYIASVKTQISFNIYSSSRGDGCEIVLTPFSTVQSTYPEQCDLQYCTVLGPILVASTVQYSSQSTVSAVKS